MQADRAALNAGDIRPCSWWSQIIIAAWFGLVAGLGEVAVRCACYLLRAEHLFYNEHFLWMTPAAETLLFSGGGIAVAAMLRPLFPQDASTILVTVLSFLAALGIAMSSGAMYAWCALLLAAGLAWRLGSLARRRPRWFPAFCRATIPLAAGTALSLAAVVFGWQWRQDAQAPAAGVRSGPRLPNVLLVVLDTVRADALSVYAAGGATTPCLDALARRALVFDSALAPCSWTLPSHASFLTGRYPCELSVGWYRGLDDRRPTLAEVLGGRGFATAGFVGNTKYCPRTSGLQRGFGHYEDFPFGWGEILRHSVFVQILERKLGGFGCLGVDDELGRKPARQVTDGFLRWLNDCGSRPFFAFLNYYDAHAPYLPSTLPDRQESLTDDEKATLRELAEAEGTECLPQAGFLRQCYLAKVGELDAELRRLTGELERRGLLQDTLLIITADHGEQFGEHGLFSHGNSLYRPAVHVPLVIAWPRRITEGRRCTTPVSLRDLPATILDAVGLAGQNPLPGRSFRPQDDGSLAYNEGPIYAVLTPHASANRLGKSSGAEDSMWACLDQGVYLIRGTDGTLHAFDFLRDPHETRDVLRAPEYAGRIEAARRSLARYP